MTDHTEEEVFETLESALVRKPGRVTVDIHGGEYTIVRLPRSTEPAGLLPHPRGGLAMILEQAYAIHARTCLLFSPVRNRRLAHPFDVPDGMAPHEWHVSSDVYQALYDASPSPYPLPNPKSGDDGTTRLYGWPVICDKWLPAHSLWLMEANPA